MIPDLPPMRRPLCGTLPRAGDGSVAEWARWLTYVDGQIDILASLLLVPDPEGGEEHRRARWAVIRLRVFLTKLRVPSSVAPLRPLEQR